MYAPAPTTSRTGRPRAAIASLSRAREVAYFKALAFVRDRKREKLILKDPQSGDFVDRIVGGS